MAEDKGEREIRPRDEDFEIDSSYAPHETVKKKDYRERPGIVLAILGAGVVLAVLSILIYSGLRQNQWTVVTTADTIVTQEDYSDIPTSMEDTDETSPGISGKTRSADKDRPSADVASSEEEPTSEEEQDTDPEITASDPEEMPPADSSETDTAPAVPDTDAPQPSDNPVESSENTDNPAPPEGETSDTESPAEEREYQDIDYEGLIYRVENGIASVVANACNNSRIEVASEVFGYPVVGIDDNAFRGSVNVSLVIIPEGVDWISAGAFQDCPNLLQVVMPDSVSGINEAAFGPNSSVTIEASAGSFAHNFALNKGMNWIEKAP